MVDQPLTAGRDQGTAGTADNADTHALREASHKGCGVRAHLAEHLTTRGDRQCHDVDALQLLEQRRDVEQSADEIGHAFTLVSGNRARDRQHLMTASRRLSDNVAAGVSIAADYCDACHVGALRC